MGEYLICIYLYVHGVKVCADCVAVGVFVNYKDV